MKSLHNLGERLDIRNKIVSDEANRELSEITLRIVLLAAVVMTASACASKLAVFDAGSNPSNVRGIRVYQRVPYILTKQIETQKCPAKTEESIIHLAVGDPYDINFEPTQFAKTEFTLILSDDGALRQVTLNSTPQLAETIKSLGELTEKVSKLVIAAAPNCGAVTSETIVNVRRLAITSK